MFSLTQRALRSFELREPAGKHSGSDDTPRASLQRFSEKRTCRVAIGTEVQKESLEPSIK